MRCATKTLHACTRSAARAAGCRAAQEDWHDIEVRSVQRWHNVLYATISARGASPSSAVAEAVQALRQGGSAGTAIRQFNDSAN